MLNPPFQRSLVPPAQNHNSSSRKPSVVEILSSPPPLPNTPEHEDIHLFSLSRNTSMSSRSSIYNVSGSNRNTVVGIDWAEIPLAELTESNKLIAINSGYSVQKAYETLVSNNLTSLPVSLSKNDSSDLTNCLTFDYTDLNTYLLLIMNKVNVNDLAVMDIGDANLTLQQRHEVIQTTINKAKRGEEVPVDFIVKLHPKNQFVKLNEQETLYKAMETLGNGVHRVAITDVAGDRIIGILSQRRLIKYMWENARRFPSLDFYLNSTLQDLKIGSNNPISIYEDQLLIDALHKMFTERVTSLAVVDRAKLLIGNISIVDVKNVSSSKNSHLLFKPVLQFISYNLSQKGIEEGQDQFPIFHVNNQSSLGRVIAKLVATQSHRLWIVENRSTVHLSSFSFGSASNSAPNSASSPSNTNGTNGGTSHSHSHSHSISNATSSAGSNANPIANQAQTQSQTQTSGGANFTMSPRSPSTVEAVLNIPHGATSSVATEQPGLPGKLIGVVTLTDILGLFASSKSNKKIDPLFARNQRRRSSTSTSASTGRSSLDGASGHDIFRKSYTSNKGDNVFSKDT